MLADDADLADVTARLDLEFDPPIAVGQVTLDDLEQALGRLLDADRDADLHPIGCPAPMITQRLPGALGEQIPQRQLEPGTRHRVPADRLDQGVVCGHIGQFGVEHQRDQEVFEDVPGGLRGFVGIIWDRACHAFAPAGQAIGPGFDDQALTIELDPARSLERRAQRHLDMVEGEGFEAHPEIIGDRRNP